MILSDNETKVDLLNNEAIAKTIVSLVKESKDQPISIGIHGDWGAGKSSILEMVEDEMKKSALDSGEKYSCIRFNGWRHQGFEDSKVALMSCKNYRNINVGLGMHPQLVSSGYADMHLFRTLFEKSHYIGKVGLDFSKEFIGTKETQIKVFSEIIELCEQYGEKVVSIHSLKSANAVIGILREYRKQKNNKYILHWFTGSIPQMERAIELGCYFSINLRMLKTKSGIEVAKAVPFERMLLETDSPFAFKAKHISEIEKELRGLVSKISKLVGKDISEIIDENVKTVFQF